MKKKEQKGKRTLLPAEERRTSLLGTKVNAFQKRTIKEKARRCGLSVSDYLLMVGCGCEPKSRLSDDERSALRELDLHRSDLRRFFANFNSMNAEERKKILRTTASVMEWLSLLASQANEVDAFLRRVGTANRLPKEQRAKDGKEGEA